MVVAEVHVVAAHEDRRRAVAAAGDQLVGVGAQLVPHGRIGDRRQQRVGIDASHRAHLAHAVVL